MVNLPCWLQRKTCLGITALALALPGAPAAAETNRFGFTGPEIFPIDSQISQLRVADLDGDGLNDIVVVNNARSKINLLYNQTGKTNLTRQAAETRPARDQRTAARRPLPHRIHRLRETHLRRSWWPT